MPSLPPLRLTGQLTIYSGRGESLVGPLIERFEELSGISRAEFAMPAPPSSPPPSSKRAIDHRADVFYSRRTPAPWPRWPRVGSLTTTSPRCTWRVCLTELVDASGHVGSATSGRARAAGRVDRIVCPILAGQPSSTSSSEEWRGRVGWAPTNASFQAFITAMRQIHGEETQPRTVVARHAGQRCALSTRRTLRIVQAVGDGETRHRTGQSLLPPFASNARSIDDLARHSITSPTRARLARLVNVAGVAVLQRLRERSENALRFVRVLA